MIVNHLSLADFRNYVSAEVALVPGSNLFVGSNGQGKTNLVESLGYLSTLGSHRVAVDHALIRQGQESAVIRAKLEHSERQLLAEVQINRSSANRAQINRSAIKPRELPRYFSSVLFAPEDLMLIRGEPAGRRRFLDELTILRFPRMARVFSDYDRVLRQRNSLLKTARSTHGSLDKLGTLEIWDEQLIVLGSEIIEARTALVDALDPEVAASYIAIAGDDHQAILSTQLSIVGGDAEDETVSATGAQRGVMTAVEAAALFRAALDRSRRNELDRGITLVGPHRDDLLLTLNGLPARGYASHGESWSFALALKLASALLLRRESATGDPVVMLDDVFAELDESRRARLAEAVRDFDQVIITAAVYDDVPPDLTGNTVQIAHGTIVDASA
ncbi:DNA replication/repair protein RecF [soil metagenome]